MSRGLAARLRKVEAKASIGDDWQSRLHTMSDHELFEVSQQVSRALVAAHGGLEAAQEALRTEHLGSDGVDMAAFLEETLACETVGEFMGYAPGWERWTEVSVQRPLPVR